jgi:hypothetical protein
VEGPATVRYPSRRRKRASFGARPADVVKRNDTLGKPVTLPHREPLPRRPRRLCRLASRHDYVDRNPIEGMHIRLDKSKRTTVPSRRSKLNAVFKSPLFPDPVRRQAAIFPAITRSAITVSGCRSSCSTRCPPSRDRAASAADVRKQHGDDHHVTPQATSTRARDAGPSA